MKLEGVFCHSSDVSSPGWLLTGKAMMLRAKEKKPRVIETFGINVSRRPGGGGPTADDNSISNLSALVQFSMPLVAID
jgi:hypothetical protein